MNDKPEREIQREIQLALASVPGLRLWRANVGKGWVGNKEDTEIIEEQDGSTTVIIRNARPLDTHLPEGFPDLFGFLVGRIGDPSPFGCTSVFIEVKSGRGRVRPKQLAFIKAMQAAGCLAGIARSVDDAMRILAGERLL